MDEGEGYDVSKIINFPAYNSASRERKVFLLSINISSHSYLFIFINSLVHLSIISFFSLPLSLFFCSFIHQSNLQSFLPFLTTIYTSSSHPCTIPRQSINSSIVHPFTSFHQLNHHPSLQLLCLSIHSYILPHTLQAFLSNHFFFKYLNPSSTHPHHTQVSDLQEGSHWEGVLYI